MKKNETERLAFLYVCTENDREILFGEREMEFQDFCRLDYLTGSLELDHFNLELWKEYASRFQKQIANNKQEIEQGIQQRERWIQDFLEGIRDDESRKLCKDTIWKCNYGIDG